MTREEAITVLKGLSDNPLFSDQHRAAFNIAIHDIKAHHDWDINNLILINKDNYEPLEQEPTDKNFTKADIDAIVKAISAHWELIIDEIRAEIEQITDTMGVSYNQYVSKIDVLQILDKYKAESEE